MKLLKKNPLWYETQNNTELGSDRTVTITDGGQYVIEIYDGCWTRRDTFNVDLYPTPSIASLDSTIYRQVVVFAEGGTEPYSYALNNNEPQNDKTFKDLDNGEYTVYVIDSNGCEVSTNFLFGRAREITRIHHLHLRSLRQVA